MPETRRRVRSSAQRTSLFSGRACPRRPTDHQLRRARTQLVVRIGGDGAAGASFALGMTWILHFHQGITARVRAWPAALSRTSTRGRRHPVERPASDGPSRVDGADHAVLDGLDAPSTSSGGSVLRLAGDGRAVQGDDAEASRRRYEHGVAPLARATHAAPRRHEKDGFLEVEACRQGRDRGGSRPGRVPGTSAAAAAPPAGQ